MVVINNIIYIHYSLTLFNKLNFRLKSIVKFQMKTLTLLLIISIFTLQIQAQTKSSSIYEGAEIPTYKKYKETVPVRLYLLKDDELLVIKTNKESIVFQKFNIETLKVIDKKEIKKEEKETNLISFFVLGGKYHILYEKLIKNHPPFYETWETIHQEIDFDNSSFNGKATSIKTIKRAKDLYSTSLSLFYGKNIPILFFSPDSTKVLSHEFIKGDKVKNSTNFHTIKLTLYNQNFETTWQNEIKLTLPESEITILNYDCDNKGNAYISCLARDKTLSRMIPFIYKISPEGKLTEIPVKTKRSLTTSSIKTTNSGELVCAGLYYKTINNNQKSVEGLFTCKIDLSLKIKDLKYLDFPSSINNVSPKQMNDNSSLTDVKTILESDGSFGILLSINNAIPVPGNVKYLQRQVLFQVNKEQELLWTANMPKWEEEDIFYNSEPARLTKRGSVFFKKGNNYYVIDVKHCRNDSRSFMFFDSDGNFLFKRASYLRTFIIDIDGNFKKYYPEMDKEKNLFFYPKYSILTGENEMLYEGYNKKEGCLMKVRLK